MQSELEKNNAIIDKIYVCPHYIKEMCACRKPEPGLILEAAKELNIDLPNSYMIGDSLIDIEAGKKAGCKTILLADTSAAREAKPHFTARSISDILYLVN
ncbi:MAG: HAD-IIIA family hydrolase [Candidatus Staskawiczbacteria bacterium]|nr:HAD-IIIA family hydrolase [Candidatus Staskawiczbacteria bacterium]